MTFDRVTKTLTTRKTKKGVELNSVAGAVVGIMGFAR